MPIHIEAAYRQFGPMVHRRCARLLEDNDEATDAMQEVFVMLIRCEHEVDNLGTFLHVLATRHCLNRLRSRQRRPEQPDSALAYEIAHSADSSAKSHARQLLGKLFEPHPESTQLAAVLHYLDGFTLEEVAAEVGLSVSGLRKRLRQLRAQLHTLEAQP